MSEFGPAGASRTPTAAADQASAKAAQAHQRRRAKRGVGVGSELRPILNSTGRAPEEAPGLTPFAIDGRPCGAPIKQPNGADVNSEGRQPWWTGGLIPG